MTQEEKEVILKDISGRLPYEPIVQISLFRNDEKRSDIELDPHVTENIWEIIDKYCALPYLRPMSSMTEEEKEELEHLSEEYFGKSLDKQIQESFSSSNRDESRILEYIASSVITDWLNKHHFDFRNLIERGLAIDFSSCEDYVNYLKDKGLAVEAPEGNNPSKLPTN